MGKHDCRSDGRTHDQLRPLSVTYNFFKHADGSVFYQIGETKVLCSVKLQNGVPPFLRGKGTGWLTAEYSMLPAATPVRTVRDSNCTRRSGRSVEISRMIGRALRSIVRLERLGERTVFIDCDVVQADGGTRTACITGSFLALRSAVHYWEKNGDISGEFLVDELAAISVGVVGRAFMLDIDFSEDCCADGDFNFIITRSGDLVELQGTAEQRPIAWQQFESMCSLARAGIKKIFQYTDTLQKKDLGPNGLFLRKPSKSLQ